MSDPTLAVSPPKPPARLPKAISVEEVERLLAASAVGDTPQALRDKALLEVLYGTGGRISEIVGLDIDDVDTEDGVVRLRGNCLCETGCSSPVRVSPAEADGSTRTDDEKGGRWWC